MRYSISIVLLLVGLVTLRAEPIKALPEKVAYDAPRAALGKQLFYDPILSRDGSIACADCHDLHNGGDDGRMVSVGIEGRKGKRNTLSVYNSRYNFRHFWDGRADGLKAQVFMSIGNPNEMDQSVEKTLGKLAANPRYKAWFKRLYSEGITQHTVEDAIAEFEKALITPNAPFDRYLRGEEGVIDEVAKRGYALFKSKGCILCHNGINIGGNFFNQFGIFKDLSGKSALSLQEEDTRLFRVPSLRNIALTAPYMHNGKVKTLQEAVEIMSKYQLGREMHREEIDSIVAFLKTLTGEKPAIVGEK